MKFLSSEVAWCFYKSTIRSCIEYCFHDWVGATSCYLNIGISCKNWNVGLLIIHHSFDMLPHCQNVTTLGLFCRYCFGRCSPELFLLPYFGGGYTRYSNRLHDFFVSSFFTRTARLEFSVCRMLSTECFPMPRFSYFVKIDAVKFEVIKTNYSFFWCSSLGRKIFHILFKEN